MRATRAINLEKHVSETAPVILFLRTDIWDAVVFNDRNKMGPDAEYLDWDDEDLVRVVEARIQSSLGDSNLGWYDVFTDTDMRQKAKSKTYVLKRTMGRPRDILAYAQEAVKKACANGNDTVSKDDIYQAEIPYSRHIMQELSDEMGAISDEWNKALAALKTIGQRTFTKPIWLEKAEQQGFKTAKAENMLKLLVESSVVGIHNVGGGGGGSRSRFRYMDKYVTVVDGARYQVHLAVAKEMGLKDA